MAKTLYPKVNSSEITDESIWLSRRAFIKTTLSTALISTSGSLLSKELNALKSPVLRLPKHGSLTKYKDITRYNNYYEFTSDKKLVHHYAKELKTEPWTITINGEVEKPLTFDIDKLLGMMSIEERIYSLRCVEGWSMVIPWNGFPLAQLLKMAKPTSKAKYVKFTSLLDPEVMIGQRRPILNWPYTEGLRIDEAMHPLTFLASGIYGKDILPQNGAPIRLVVPWKYGYKSLKAITHITLLEKQPKTTWVDANPDNYGFYSNVNPKVSTPMWNQRKEVKIGEVRKKRTQLYNGYGEQVAHLYKDMDLTKFY
ncbi:MAG: protein-methionine-sulfoxide reductase catalytic subunit MsrP [Gammaproteobacteria bacterium]|nr:protein-methionine-sulfoxide reductase catalytic subunit MsrP [Gammaproteobacteria bacterium]